MSAPGFESQTVAALKRAVDRAPAHIASGVGRAVCNASGERLEQLMRGPARPLVLGAIFRRLPHHLQRDRAAGVRGSMLWTIGGRADGGVDTYQVEIADGRARVTRDLEGIEPRVSITVDGAELVRLATGNSDPIQAYFTGRISLTGNVMFAARLMSLFSLPGRPSARS